MSSSSPSPSNTESKPTSNAPPSWSGLKVRKVFLVLAVVFEICLLLRYILVFIVELHSSSSSTDGDVHHVHSVYSSSNVELAAVFLLAECLFHAGLLYHWLWVCMVHSVIRFIVSCFIGYVAIIHLLHSEEDRILITLWVVYLVSVYSVLAWFVVDLIRARRVVSPNQSVRYYSRV